MATADINSNGKTFRKRFFIGGIWYYQEHASTVVRTVGYTTSASAISAASAAAAANVIVNWQQDSPGLWSITVETDTVGDLTPE